MKSNSKRVAYTQNDRYAEVFLKDGRRIRHELNIGSGYMSQNGAMVSYVPGLTDRVVIMDGKNQSRTVFQSAALAAK
jgi:hypothetical protein